MAEKVTDGYKQKNIDDAVRISFEAFCASELDSRQWYDALPGDDVQVDGVPRLPTLSTLVAHIQRAYEGCEEAMLDQCAAHLLNGSWSSITRHQWQTCSEQLSRLMAAQLTITGSRSLRMRAQRLHYYIQQVLAQTEEAYGLEFVKDETVLAYTKPWDYLQHPTGKWWISCDEQNITHHTANGQKQTWRIGLPTQLDALDAHHVVIGSLYTNGCMISDALCWQEVAHEAPILNLWKMSDQSRWFIDYHGMIWCNTPRRAILKLPCTQVHFARFYDGILYAMNNGDFGHVWIVNCTELERESSNYSGADHALDKPSHAALAQEVVTRQSVLPVWVCNDLTVTPKAYYLIDKQQGSIFKFDRQWRYEKKILTFGRGKGQLLDPVSIRVAHGKLHTISWLSAKHTVTDLF